MNSPSAGALINGFGAVFFVLAINSPNVLSFTEVYPIFHLEIMAAGLYFLSLGPFVLFLSRLVRAGECRSILKAQTFGLIIGLVTLVTSPVLFGLSAFYFAHAIQLFITFCLSLFFMVYDASFSNMFSQMAETGISSKPRLGPDLLSRRGLSRMLSLANIYPIPTIVALLVTAQSTVVLAILAIQIVASLVGFGLQGLSIKRTQQSSSLQGQSAIPTS